MAKKGAKEGPNKSQLIRDYMNENPNEGPKAVAEAMQKLHGVSVTAQFVSTVKANAKRAGGSGKKPGRRGRKPGVKTAASAPSKAGGVSIESLKAAKKFIAQMGGSANAKAAVDLLAGLFD